jgi:hypothetical protein
MVKQLSDLLAVAPGRVRALTTEEVKALLASGSMNIAGHVVRKEDVFVNSKFTGDTSKYDAASGGSGSVVVVVNHVMSPELLELVCRASASVFVYVCSNVVVYVCLLLVCVTLCIRASLCMRMCVFVAHVCDSRCVFAHRGSRPPS